MKYKELPRRLKILGCQEIPRRGGGSHRKWINPLSEKGTVIPDWGNKDLKLGTVRIILKQLKIELEEFEKV